MPIKGITEKSEKEGDVEPTFLSVIIKTSIQVHTLRFFRPPFMNNRLDIIEIILKGL